VAVKIRLKRMGKIRTPFYRIVVADARTKRDGRVIEEIGTYNPKTDPSLINVDSERAQHWLSVGAQPSEPVRALLRKTGDWQTFRGEPAPPPLLVAESRRDKGDIFNEALQEAHGSSSSEAVTAKKAPAKRTAKKTAPAAEQAAAEPPAAEAPAPEPPAAEPPAPADAASDLGPDVAVDTGDDAADEASTES